MEYSGGTLDDLMKIIFEELISKDFEIKTSRGNTSEIIGAHLHLKNPRARLSHTDRKGRVFSGLGELFWYLSEADSLDFITYYLPQLKEESVDGRTLYGAYGPRLFNQRGHDQINNIKAALQKSKNTRRAVVQLFNAEDISNRKKEIPCTCTFQFICRENKLHMVVSMRSNDAFLGLPHDVFSFTMIQEIIARALGCDVGEYFHYVACMHLYEEHREKARQYIDEGWQCTEGVAMPVMPEGDPQSAIDWLKKVEEQARADKPVDLDNTEMDPYWLDLARLFNIYHFWKGKDFKSIEILKNKMHSNVYDEYICRKLEMTSD